MTFDKNLQSISSDLLIVGGGPAGCFAALKAKEAGVRDVLVVDKGYVGKSGCATFGAGSFKGFIPNEDPYEIWFEKAVEAGCYMNDQDWTQVHLEEVYERVRDLEAWGSNSRRILMDLIVGSKDRDHPISAPSRLSCSMDLN
jgi:succinate dehydrogenase/fumarate reductase flavoprotein subunit